MFPKVEPVEALDPRADVAPKAGCLIEPRAEGVPKDGAEGGPRVGCPVGVG